MDVELALGQVDSCFSVCSLLIETGSGRVIEGVIVKFEICLTAWIEVGFV